MDTLIASEIKQTVTGPRDILKYYFPKTASHTNCSYEANLNISTVHLRTQGRHKHRNLLPALRINAVHWITLADGNGWC